MARKLETRNWKLEFYGDGRSRVCRSWNGVAVDCVSLSRGLTTLLVQLVRGEWVSPGRVNTRMQVHRLRSQLAIARLPNVIARNTIGYVCAVMPLNKGELFNDSGLPNRD